MSIKIVICPTCLRKYNMSECVVGGTCSAICSGPFASICCPHCGDITYARVILSQQDELKRAMEEQK